MGLLKNKIEDRITKFKSVKDGKLIWIAKDWDNLEFRNFIDQFNTNPPNGQVIDDGRNDLIKINKGFKSDLVVKKFNLTRTYDKLRFCLLDSKAIRSLRLALALEEIGIRTPKPIAVVEKRGQFNKLLYSYYISEHVEYDYNLLDIVADDDHPRRSQVKNLVAQIAQDVRKMHNYGIIHNDLHAGNILVKDIDEDPKFYYIDLNRGRIKDELSTKEKVQDLARFKLTRAEKKLFVKSYAPNNDKKLLELMIKERKKRRKFLNLKRSIRDKMRFWK